MLYTLSYKKQVVKKALSAGVVGSDICRKLHISSSSLYSWIRLYGAEMRSQAEEIDLGLLLDDEPVDVDDLLRAADTRLLGAATGSTSLASHIDALGRTGKTVAAFTDRDKFAVVKTVRALSTDKRGAFLRRHGLDDRHIALWEEELIAMSKTTITHDEYTKKLEEENKQLKKQLAAAERDKHELEVIIELKKKYPTLFMPGGDEK
jgi:hypothetical protein